MLIHTVRNFWVEDDGIGVIEVVLILVVLIGLVIIFKGQITSLLNDIFSQINSQSKEVY
jgi:Flp pilus assembly pilin Flp